MRKIIYLSFLIATTIAWGQKETCDTDEKLIEDLNSITKCTVKQTKNKKDKKSRQISVRVSASKKRFLKRRKKHAATEANQLNSSGVSTIEGSSNLKSLKIKTNLAALKNSLSREELRAAQKFGTVDAIPAFPNCESNGDQLECFNSEMIKHIQEYFIYPNEALLNKQEGEVWVRFIIDKNGNVTNIKTLGPKGGKILNDEAVRVVSNLPKFKPATKDGKPVSVKYGFPINFSLEDN
ncbi:energy transducer TonB [Tenacibaculum jejuense]|uniref:TonB family protein n=1 Tax=Tenacibaculum jejuense TaxID=584609 RepID=A0A238U9N5_9FLAO|nr:energy transducer TonB [Tenacibaculum jejuense]SNR15278.1 TonB family protein precursor [Tenacibaculum jejuense]